MLSLSYFSGEIKDKFKAEFYYVGTLIRLKNDRLRKREGERECGDV